MNHHTAAGTQGATQMLPLEMRNMRRGGVPLMTYNDQWPNSPPATYLTILQTYFRSTSVVNNNSNHGPAEHLGGYEGHKSYHMATMNAMSRKGKWTVRPRPRVWRV